MKTKIKQWVTLTQELINKSVDEGFCAIHLNEIISTLEELELDLRQKEDDSLVLGRYIKNLEGCFKKGTK